MVSGWRMSSPGLSWWSVCWWGTMLWARRDSSAPELAIRRLDCPSSSTLMFPLSGPLTSTGCTKRLVELSWESSWVSSWVSSCVSSSSGPGQLQSQHRQCWCESETVGHIRRPPQGQEVRLWSSRCCAHVFWHGESRVTGALQDNVVSSGIWSPTIKQSADQSQLRIVTWLTNHVSDQKILSPDSNHISWM